MCLPIPKCHIASAMMFVSGNYHSMMHPPKPGIGKRYCIINAGWLYLKKRRSSKKKRKVKSINYL
jgi:hypothetical protein